MVRTVEPSGAAIVPKVSVSPAPALRLDPDHVGLKIARLIS